MCCTVMWNCVPGRAGGEYLSLLQHSVTHESFNHIRPIGKGGYGQLQLPQNPF